MIGRFSIHTCLLAGLATPVMTQAQALDGGEDAPADAIIVTGRGLDEAPATPAYSRVELPREQIITAPSGRIEEALSLVAGFQQFRRSDSRSSNPSAQGATLRALGGNATSRALVLLDGVPVSDPFFGFVPFNALSPERLGRVVVTRGGGSGPFGAGALAGTIELESADSQDLSALTANVLVNERGETETSALGTARLGAGHISGGVRWDRGKGFFTAPDDQRVPASARAAFDVWSANLRAVVPVSPDITLQARGLVFDDRRTLRFDGADSSSEGQDASLRLVGRGKWQFDVLAYLQARNFSNVVISSTRFTRVLDQRNTPSTGVGGKLELRPPVGDNHVVRLGMDYRRASGELQEEAFSAFSGALRERRRAGGATNDLGLFVEHDWTVGPLVLTGGLRADRTRITDGFFLRRDADNVVTEALDAPDRSDWTVSYRAGAAYEVSEELTLRGAAYSGLRLPTLNELYRPFVVFPVVTEANAELANERLQGFELGFDWRPVGGIELAVTGFDNRVEDAIANVSLEPNLRQRRNLPAIEAQGIEASLSAQRGRISFFGSVSYTDAEIEGVGPSLSLDGNRPPQVPELSAAAQLIYSAPSGWQMSARVNHIGVQFETDQEDGRLPAATTLGATLAIPVSEGFTVVGRVENLTNEEVVTRNSNGALDLGSPRTFWIGVRFGM